VIDATFNGVSTLRLRSSRHGQTNALIFTNSYKMKMSIILGVIHVSVSLIYIVGADGLLDDVCSLLQVRPYTLQRSLDIYTNSFLS